MAIEFEFVDEVGRVVQSAFIMQKGRCCSKRVGTMIKAQLLSAGSRSCVCNFHALTQLFILPLPGQRSV